MVDIDPNGTALPGIDRLRIIVGAVMMVGLILSVLALIISASAWGFGADSSTPHLASHSKLGVLVSCGAAVTLINLFWNVAGLIHCSPDALFKTAVTEPPQMARTMKSEAADHAFESTLAKVDSALGAQGEAASRERG